MSNSPLPPSDMDVLAALKKRFTDDNLMDQINKLRNVSEAKKKQFPVFQKDEAVKGTPFPYVIVEVGRGTPYEASSSRTTTDGRNKSVRFQMFDSPVIIRTHAITDEIAYEISVLIAKSIDRDDLPLCEGSRFVTLFRTAPIVTIPEGDEKYSSSLHYTIRIESEALI